MFDWIPEVAKGLRSELVEVYWGLLVVVLTVAVIVEFFRIADSRIDPTDLLKRTLVSILLLWSFEYVIVIAGELTEAIVDKMGGEANLDALLEAMGERYESDAPSLFRYRDMFIYAFNLLCYALGAFGYLVMRVFSNFVYTILYVLSPLLILAYVPRQTAYITANLYKGVFNVCVWKILWFLLGTLFYELATAAGGEGWDGVFMGALMNLCIGLSMLMVPVFANSLFGTGLSATATTMIAGTAAPLNNWITGIPGRAAGGIKREFFSGLPRTRKLAGRIGGRAKTIRKRLHTARQKRKLDAIKKRAIVPKK